MSFKAQKAPSAYENYRPLAQMLYKNESRLEGWCNGEQMNYFTPPKMLFSFQEKC